MPVVLLIGGARSGKSRLAMGIASARGSFGTVIATGEARDAEMAERIRRHRAERPEGWRTIEEPVDVATALGSLPEEVPAVLDCLTLWVSNLMERGSPDAQIEDLAGQAADTAAARPGVTAIVTNEVGSGIVPATAEARRYRDLLGRVNAIWAERAQDVLLVVAGRVLPLAHLEAGEATVVGWTAGSPPS